MSVNMIKNPYANYFASWRKVDLASFVSRRPVSSAKSERQATLFLAAAQQHSRLVKADLRSFIRSGR